MQKCKVEDCHTYFPPANSLHVYCGEECRLKAQKARRMRKNPYVRPGMRVVFRLRCQRCRKWFMDSKRDEDIRKWCSNACRQANYREELKERESRRS